MGTNQKRKARFIKQIIILIALVALITGALFLYIKYYNSGSKICGKFSSSQNGAPISVRSPRLCFEIAETEGKRAKGLMYRKPADLPEREGMIFIYAGEGQRSFWMKNTFTALDMFFMSSELKVVGIIEDATPLSESPRKVDKPSQYIVELHAGSAKKWGIETGAVLELEEELPEGRN